MMPSETPGEPSSSPAPDGSRRDPLHGVTLERIVSHLHAEYGWEELARRIPVKCFQSQPSVGSSLKFLRKTPWAREQVEGEYVRLIHRENANGLILAVKTGGLSAELPVPSQTKAHEALGWALRHGRPETELRALLDAVQDVAFWPDAAPMPLLNLAIDRDAPPAFIRDLLKRGARADDGRYWLPLLHTVDVEGQAYQTGRRAPRTDVLDLLLGAGADPTQADPRGHTALAIAQAYGLKAVVNKLRG